MNKIVMISAFCTAAMVAMLGVSTPVAAQETTPVRVCTGKAGGNYDFTGLKLKDQLRGSTEIELVPTAGSWENLQKLDSGACDVAITQTDVLYVYTKEASPIDYYSLGAMYTEYVHLLCNRKSAVEQWSDLTKDTKVFVGEKGSGAEVTARGLKQAEKDYGSDSYAKVPYLVGDKPEVSLIKLKGGSADCLVYVGSKGNKFMSTTASKLAADLVLRPVVDKDFNDVTMKDANGNEISVWTPVEMPYDTYEKLMPTGMLGRKDVETIGVNSMMIVSNRLVETNPEAYANIGFAIGDVVNIVKAEKKVELVIE